MKIYSRTGDDGSTGLFGGGRVRKDDLRVEAYGAVDESNAAIGMARSLGLDADLDKVLAQTQLALFDLGADLATPLDATARKVLKPVADEDVAELEALIDRFEEEVEPLRQFIVPGGHPASAALQLARTICRRAERSTVRLTDSEPVSEACLRYLNRLGDLLFVLARVANARHGVSEARFLVPQRSRQDGAD